MSFSDLIKTLSKIGLTIFYFISAISAMAFAVVVIKSILGIFY